LGESNQVLRGRPKYLEGGCHRSGGNQHKGGLEKETQRPRNERWQSLGTAKKKKKKARRPKKRDVEWEGANSLATWAV